MTALAAFLIEAAPSEAPGLHGLPGPVLLLATVLYNVLFVATVSVAAVWPKNYVRTVDLDANVGVAPSSVRDPAVPGRRERPGRGPCVGPSPC